MNRKIRKVFTRTISMLIITVMIAGTLPLTVLADELGGGDTQAATEYSESDTSGNDQEDYLQSSEEETAGGISEDVSSNAMPVDGDAAADDDLSSESDEVVFEEGSADLNSDMGSAGDPVNIDIGPVSKEFQAAPANAGATLNRLSISRDETDFPSGSSYVMAETEGQEFLVNYRYSDLENVILVVECLEFGADFAAIPEKNEFFNEATLIGQGKMALRLTNAADRTDCTIGFRMKHVKLTDEQTIRIMDSEVIPSTRIAATEYTLPANADLADVLTEGTKGEECILWEGTPYFNPNSTVGVTSSASGYTHTYKATVSFVSNESVSYTNYYFDRICSYNYENIFNGYKNGSPRFSLPCAYNKSGSLMEIVGIRFYEPTELVRLRELSAAGAGSTGNGDLLTKDFNANWGGWTVGERTFDPDKNAYYYDITPPNRAFNNNSKDMDEYLAGMTLRWTMADPANALDPDSSYLAENTVITFRLPGDGQNTRTAEVRGPEIITGKKEYMDLKRDFNNNHAADTPWRQNVNVGVLTSEVFCSMVNGIYDTAASTKFPAYDGPVTLEYEFPYQIAPQKITMELKRSQLMDPNEHPVLEGISYTTWDSDTWIEADQSSIDSINTEFGKINGASSTSYALSADSQVKTVRIKWSQLSIWDRPASMPYVNVGFEYIANHCKDKDCSEHLAQNVQVQVKYREYYDSSYMNGVFKPDDLSTNMLLPGQTSASVQTVESHFWFRLNCKACEPKKCPDLIGNAEDNTYEFFNSGICGNVGDLGFDIGDYGSRYDSIHNPEITLKLLNAGDPMKGGVPIENITNDQMIAFFTGEFTAMPKLSGWIFTYTAENKEHNVYSNTVTIPEITDEKGIKDCWLPLPEGYAFTSVKLSYEGEFDVSHKDENDKATRIWLMNDIVVHRNDDIPFLDKKVQVRNNRVGKIQLAGSVTFDITELADENGPNCACGKHVSGQEMIYTTVNTPAAVYVQSTRGTTYYLYEPSKPADAVIYQGEGVGDSPSEDASITWDINGGILFAGGDGFQVLKDEIASFHPYEDINEAIYIELTDEEFIPDLDNSMLWGYPLSDKCIQTEIIIVYDSSNNPHRFLKLQFVEGFVRTKCYVKIKNTSKYEWVDNGIRTLTQGDKFNGVGYDIVSIDGHLYRTGAMTGPFKLAFKTVPGTTIGEHNPVGKIYYDFSDLEKNYKANLDTPRDQWTGYDNNWTYYNIRTTDQYYTKDNLGLTGDKKTQLFVQDGSNWTVNVLLHQETGVSLVPGKNQTYYDYDNRVIDFYPGEENDLNALMTLTGPGEPTASSIYDVTSITVLPRTGKAIEYTESEINQGTQTDFEKVSDESTMNIYLRGVPYVIGNSADTDPVFTYTTSEDPLSDAAVWMNSEEISNWKSVTGIKVVMNSMAPKTSVNIRLDLETDAKTDLDTLTAFAGGNFKYRLTQHGSFIEPQHLELSNWLYESYEIKGFLFWDIYDEDGLYDKYYDNEAYGVPVTLYDASGNVIPQTRGTYCIDPSTGTFFEDGSVMSDYNGNFILYSNIKDAGQYIVVGSPEPYADSVVALTAVSSEPYTISDIDSDFDRSTHKLVLGQLESRSGYNNVSAGYIILPAIRETDIDIYVGQSLTTNAVIDEYVFNMNYDDNNILTNGTYKIEHIGVDESIATISDYGKLVRSTDFTLMADHTFTGVTPGSFTVTSVLTNRVGDTVSTDFKVTVRARPDEDIVVTNSWDDDNNRDGIRPDGITVQLMKNGEAEGSPVVLNEANKETYTWSKVPRFDNDGIEIEYTISVKPIADVPGHTGYTQNVSKSDYKDDLTSSSGGYEFTVRNVHIPETVDLKVTKVWEDDNNRDGIRPGSITASLSDGTSAVLNEGNSWTFTASGRYKYENGKEIEYKWTEVNVPDGYELSVDVSGYKTTLTNKHDPETVERTVVAVWLDDDNVDGIRPIDLTVGLSDGSSVTIDANNSWGITVATLYKYEDGKLMDYTWTAPAVPDGYTFSQTVEGTITTLVYVHKPSKIATPPAQKTGTSLPSTGENIAPEVSLAISCIMLSGAMVFIAVSRSRKKENR